MPHDPPSEISEFFILSIFQYVTSPKQLLLHH